MILVANGRAFYNKVRYAALTVYSCVFCIIIGNYFHFAGLVTYVSPTLAAVVSSKFLGVALKKYWDVIPIVIISSFIAVIIGLTWNYKILQLFLLFIAIVWLNRCTYIGQSGKIFGGVSLVVGSLLPNLTLGDPSYMGLYAYYKLLTLTFFPFTISIFCSYFPYPVLAIVEAKEKVNKISNSISSIIDSVIRSFITNEYTDLYIAEIENKIEVLQNEVDSLKELIEPSEYEVIFYPKLSAFYDSIILFHDNVGEIIHEVRNLRDIAANIIKNSTHTTFVHHINSHLDKISFELDTSIQLLLNYLENMEYHEPNRINILRRFFAFLSQLTENHSNNYENNDDFKQSSGINVQTRNRSQTYLDVELVCFDDTNNDAAMHHDDEKDSSSVRTDYINQDINSTSSVYDRSPRKNNYLLAESAAQDKNSSSKGYYLDTFNDNKAHMASLVDELLSKYQFVRKKYVWGHSDVDAVSNAVGSELRLEDPDIILIKQIKEDTLRCSLRKNIGQRHSFLLRLFILIDLVQGFSKIYTKKCTKPWNFSEFCVRLFHTTCRYVYDLRDISLNSWNNHKNIIDLYSQPVKIALAICFMAIFVVFRDSQDFYQNSLWATIVIAIIRQDSSSSSFLFGYQRLEGTVIGGIYSYAIHKLMRCGVDVCNMDKYIGWIAAWLLVCAFFREGKHHGYAAIVAGFTPIIIFMGPLSNSSGGGAFIRIEKTFYGVFVYLIIDNLILPHRTDAVIRQQVIKSIEEIIIIFENSIKSFNILVDEQYQLMAKPGTPTASAARSDNIVIDIPSFSDDVFLKCDEYLAAAKTSLLKLNSLINTQFSSLSLVVFEPELWYRAFPLRPYSKLLDATRKVVDSGIAVNSGISSFKSVLRTMSARNQCDDLSNNISIVYFMNTQIIDLSKKADIALNLASEVLHKLYEDSVYVDGSYDLTSILTLSRNIDKTLSTVDEHFHTAYTKQAELKDALDIKFLITWQSAFDHICGFIKALQVLGLALYAVSKEEEKILKREP